MKITVAGLAAFLFAMNLNLFAQTPPPAPPLPPEARQFDFWIGEWEVTNPAGKVAGRSSIELVAGGAGVLENWTGATGYTGRSLNAWNAAKKQWQQYWVGSDGGVLELAGGIAEGRMVLSAEREVRGQRRLERITWTPNADGTVRQHWEQSIDGGKTWTTAFDGLYRKKTSG
jgi:hypothetical protein